MPLGIGIGLSPLVRNGSVVNYGPNIILNGTFNVNVNNWGASSGNITCIRDTSIFSDGAIKVIKGSNDNVGIKQTLTGLIPLKTYKVTCDAYAPSSNTCVNAAVISTKLEAHIYTDESAQVTAENEVQKLSFWFTATATTATIYLMVLNRDIAWGSSLDVAYFDNIIVCQDFTVDAINKKIENIISKNTVTITESGIYSGKTALRPDGGNFYGDYIFIRDMVMTEDSYIEPFSTDLLLNSYKWYKTHIPSSGENANVVPITIYKDGTVSATHAKDQLDNRSYFVGAAYNYFKKSNDTSFVTDELTYLKTLLDFTPVSVNGLVKSADESGAVVGWGFYDSLYMSGELLYCSCLLWRAYTQLAEMSLAINSMTIYEDCISKAANIKTKINSTFYVADSGKYYMKASTGLCSGQFDVSGTCFAIYLGIVEETEANLISAYIVSIISEITTYGGVKWVPNSHCYTPGSKMWESENAANTFGHYQSGGEWLTSLAWLIYTVKKTNLSLAKTIICSAVDKTIKTRNAEWWDDTNVGALDYSTSAALALANHLV